MPLYEFRCSVCGVEREFTFSAHSREFQSFAVEQLSSGRHPCQVADCDGMLARQWNPPAIGRVPGAGGSPSRGSR